MNTGKIEILTVTMFTKVPHIEQGTYDDNTKQSQTLAMLCEQSPPEPWTNVCTDGSSTNAIQDSWAGIVIYFPIGSTEAASTVTRRHHSNYKADSETLMMVIYLSVDSQQNSIMTVFLTDALSVLQTLTNNKLARIAKALQLLLSNNCRVALQWIPTQCRVPGNEQADTLAKQGAQTKQPGANVSYQENAIITKASMMSSQEKYAYQLLSRPEQVIMVTSGKHTCIKR